MNVWKISKKVMQDFKLKFWKFKWIKNDFNCWNWIIPHIFMWKIKMLMSTWSLDMGAHIFLSKLIESSLFSYCEYWLNIWELKMFYGQLSNLTDTRGSDALLCLCSQKTFLTRQVTWTAPAAPALTTTESSVTAQCLMLMLLKVL